MIRCFIKYYSHCIVKIIFIELVCLVARSTQWSFNSNNSNNLDYLLSSVSNSTQISLFSSNQTSPITNQKSEYEFYKRLAKLINITISPILLTLGGIGNPLCIIILTQKQKKNPTVIYLCFLAAFDFLVLYTGLLRLFLKDAFNIDIRIYSSFNCKIHMFLTYTFMQISSYILVAVTVNRFTIMFNRTIFCKQKSISRIKENDSDVKRVFWIFSIISVVVSLVNMHFLIYYDTIQTKSSNAVDCTIQKQSNYYTFRTKYYGKMHLYLAIVVPFCILFVLNLLIIRKIMVSTRNSSALKQQKSVNSYSTSHSNNKKGEKRTALSIMLVSVCLWFMILKTPASVYLTFPATEVQKIYFPLVYSVLMLVNYTNHAVNLILYIATSSIFRNDFKEFFMNVKNAVFSKFSKPTAREQNEDTCADDKNNNNRSNKGIKSEKSTPAKPILLNNEDEDNTMTEL
jgi:hypothetical protein